VGEKKGKGGSGGSQGGTNCKRGGVLGRGQEKKRMPAEGRPRGGGQFGKTKGKGSKRDTHMKGLVNENSQEGTKTGRKKGKSSIS